MSDPINKKTLPNSYDRDTLSLNLAVSAKNYQCWMITNLPKLVWSNLIGYLSLQDVNHLGVAFAGTSKSLNFCGVSEVQYYCSLPENQKRFFKKMSVSNQQLIDYIRSTQENSTRNHVQSCMDEISLTQHTHESIRFTYQPNLFLIKRFPEAIISCFANYVFNHVSRTDNLTLIKRFEIENDRRSGYLNDNFNRILDPSGYKINIWLANSDGSWELEETVDGNNFNNKYSSQHNASLLLAPRFNPGEEMDIWERNHKGEWAMIQHMTFADIGFTDDIGLDYWLGKMISRDIRDIFLSHDAQSAVCTSFRNSVILGRDPDGHWCYKATTPLGQKVCFSEDSKHIAMLDDTHIFFMSNHNDQWEESGVLVFDVDIEEEYLEFSPDNRHLVAWFDDAGDDEYEVFPRRKDFHIKIASYDGHRWSEQEDIIEWTDRPKNYLTLNAQFSQDGQHLLVCTRDEIKVWTLGNDNKWTYTDQCDSFFNIENEYCFNNPTVCCTMNPSKIMLVTCDHWAVFNLSEDGLLISSIIKNHFHEFQPVISPDGNSVICQNQSRHAEIWQRLQGQEWEKQIFEQLFEVAKFNHGGYLLALKNGGTLILFGLTGNSTWHRKTHLVAEGTIENFSFSPCDRFIVISTCKGGRTTKTLWQINFDENTQN